MLDTIKSGIREDVYLEIAAGLESLGYEVNSNSGRVMHEDGVQLAQIRHFPYTKPIGYAFAVSLSIPPEYDADIEHIRTMVREKTEPG